MDILICVICFKIHSKVGLSTRMYCIYKNRDNIYSNKCGEAKELWRQIYHTIGHFKLVEALGHDTIYKIKPSLV